MSFRLLSQTGRSLQSAVNNYPTSAYGCAYAALFCSLQLPFPYCIKWLTSSYKSQAQPAQKTGVGTAIRQVVLIIYFRQQATAS